MKRTQYTATVHTQAGELLATRTAWAHNSANRAALDALRDLGGAERVAGPAQWDDARTVCRSSWTLTDGRWVTVTVAPTADHPQEP